MTTTMTLGDRFRFGIHAAASLVLITALCIVAITAGEVLIDPPALVTFLELCAIPFVVRAYWHYAGIMRFSLW